MVDEGWDDRAPAVSTDIMVGAKPLQMKSNLSVQHKGASRLAELRFGGQRRLASAADARRWAHRSKSADL